MTDTQLLIIILCAQAAFVAGATIAIRPLFGTILGIVFCAGIWTVKRGLDAVYEHR